MPCIIYELKGKEDMAANLRVGFKERQHKCLFEAITVAPPPTKRSYTEEPRVASDPNTPLAPMPLTDGVGPSSAPVARPSARKDAHHEQVELFTSPPSASKDFDEKEASTPSHPPVPRALGWEEMVELLK